MNTYEKNQIIGLLYRIFQAENYKWTTSDNKSEIPTLEEINESVDYLEDSAYNSKGSAESGRLHVHYEKETNSFEYYLNVGVTYNI